MEQRRTLEAVPKKPREHRRTRLTRLWTCKKNRGGIRRFILNNHSAKRIAFRLFRV
jgi:hypothetical protein